MLIKNCDFEGSNNSTGFLQTLIALKIRDLYGQVTMNEGVEAGSLEYMD